MARSGLPPSLAIPADLSLGDGVTIGDGTLLAEGMLISADVVIEQGVVFAPAGASTTRIAAKVRIGAGAVTDPDIEIGWGANVLPGSVVLSSVPANAIVRGNPAQIVGYTQGIAAATDLHGGDINKSDRRRMNTTPLAVGGAMLYQMPRISDLRGSLSVGELGEGFPFVPKRYFIVFDVPSEELRGEHAHRVCHQFLICVKGSCHALLDDGTARSEVVLDRPDLGLHMPAMIWGTQYRYTRDAVLLVLASHAYDAADYIRTYDGFRKEVAERQP